jgi:hypothetical protein
VDHWYQESTPPRLDRMSLARHTLIACLASVGAGCALFNDDPSLLLVAITDRAATAPADPMTLTITAINTGAGRVVWGRGSSSCQLGAVVAVTPYVWRSAGDLRVCTDDLVEQGLDPGAARTEQILWDGQVWRDGANAYLPAGNYELRAATGERGRSRPVRVTVLPPSLP